MALEIAQMSRPASALAAAITMLSRHEPFASMPLKAIIGTVNGAIARGHYVFTVEDGRIRGFGSWALTTEAAAEAWLAGRLDPATLSGAQGDVVALMLSVGDHPRAPALAMRHVAKLYPGQRYTYPRSGRPPIMGRFPDRAPGEAGQPPPGEAPDPDAA